MKLSYRIISHISVVLLILLTVWATAFYYIIIDEINDETDDSLEEYSEYIITRALAGETLPSKDNGTNNSYHITKVTSEYANQHSKIRYFDEMTYVYSKDETEPARILKTIFRDTAGQYYELTVSIPTIEKEDLQEAILHWIIILYLILLFVIIIINVWILHHSFKPLYTLLQWLDNFRVDKKNIVPEIDTNITEFRKLNNAIMQSATRNIKAYELQKEFTEHAAHELQTPLAACRNRLEMLSEDSLLNKNQLTEIMKARQSLDHIIKLNKTLLLLTKIESDQFPDKKEIVINDIVRKLSDDYVEVYTNHNISFSIQEDVVLKANMNETLASILLGNLLKNAYIHNRDNGSIQVHITGSGIIISNTGNETSLDPNHIFSRFYHGTKKEGSTGLGLALCKSICRLYKINILYKYYQGKHIFSVFF